MKLKWCPQTAENSYIDTVKQVSFSLFKILDWEFYLCFFAYYLILRVQLGSVATESSSAEFLSAMAGGWKTKLIVEAWSSSGTSTATIMSSIGLTIAANHTGGRHVCIVPDDRTRNDYISAMMRTSPCSSSGGGGVGLRSLPEVMVGDSEVLLEKLNGIDFLVVDGQRMDVSKIFCLAKLSHLGGVLVCRNTSQRAFSKFRWNRVLDTEDRVVVRSLSLPNGLDFAYVAALTVRSRSSPNCCWISHIDQQSGEEHVYRR